MTKPYDQSDINYIAGFEAGCNFLIAEIEWYMREHGGSEAVLAPMIRHLKSDPEKKVEKVVDKV